MKRGMKPRYKTSVQPYLEEIAKLIEEGATEKSIYKEVLGISHHAYYTYKREVDEFNEIIKTAQKRFKMVKVEELRNALYERAEGKKYVEIKTYVEKDENGKEKKRIEKTEKMVFSDSCLIFALKNLDYKNFRDRREHEHIGMIPVQIVDDIKNDEK